MNNRILATTAVFASLGVAYTLWLRFEAARVERAAWAEITDPV